MHLLRTWSAVLRFIDVHLFPHIIEHKALCEEVRLGEESEMAAF